MGIKAKLGMSVATGVLAFGLIGGGTYAYFSDSVSSMTTFSAGTLDLDIQGDGYKIEKIDLNNFKPGDSISRKFMIQNKGSLDIGKLNLVSKVAVRDLKNDNGNYKFTDHLMITVKGNNKTHTLSLTELNNITESGWDILGEVVNRDVLNSKDKESQTLEVDILFKNDPDNDEVQNLFQGDSLTVDLEFKALQGEGTTK